MIWTTVVLASGLLMGAAGAASDPLARLVWKTRPVVVVADRPDDGSFKRQMAILDAHRHALTGYDITVVPATGPAAGLRRKLGLPAQGFAVALVGKDGGVKETWSQPVEPGRIFALIDKMPMRQDEVQRRRGAD
jgi:hypothetical protein